MNPLTSDWIRLISATESLMAMYSAPSAACLSNVLSRKIVKADLPGVNVSVHQDGTRAVHLSACVPRKCITALYVLHCKSWFNLAGIVVSAATVFPDDDELQVSASKIVAGGLASPAVVVSESVRSIRRGVGELGLDTSNLDRIFGK